MSSRPRADALFALTVLALLVVDALQLGRTGAWTAIDARRAIASEPAHCLLNGAD